MCYYPSPRFAILTRIFSLALIMLSGDYRILLRGWIALCAISLAGCQLLDTGVMSVDEATLLKAASASPEAVTIEIYWATLSEGTEEATQQLWSQVQENRLSPELRGRLARNGLRAGVFGGSLPTGIEDLLDPEHEQSIDMNGAHGLLKQSGVWKRTRQMRPGDQLELKASEIQPSAPLLIPRNGGLEGGTFANAQAFYRLEVGRLASGGCELSLTPEVRHGVAKPRWTPDETGMISPATPRKDAEVFADLAIRAPLSAGEVLLVTSMPQSNCRLGGYLHASKESTEGVRKAILLRVVQAPRDESLADLSGLEAMLERGM